MTSNIADAGVNSQIDIWSQLVKRRKRSWIRLFIALLVISLIVAFFGFPQYYASTVSLAMQQSSPANSSLAGLLSMGSLNKKYVGVLKSRNFVDIVEEQAHVRELYEIKRNADLYEKYTRCVKFDDNANDGLIYIVVSLDGPPLWLPGQQERREKVRQTTAVIGNAYHKALLNYLVNVDTDKELVLLRMADAEVKQARLDYDISMNRLARFVRSRKIKPNALPTMPSTAEMATGMNSTGGQDATSSASQFLGLFAKKAQLEAQLAAANAMHSRLQTLLNYPLEEVASIPGEDPLLFDARRNYNEAIRAYDTLKSQLGPDNPRLISARTNARLAEGKLRAQISAVLNGNTTEQLNLASLKTTYVTVARQVEDAEKNFQLSRELTTDLGRLTSEVALSLKVLETAKTASETLKMSTVAARNRMNVVDEARPEDKSHPGKGILISISFLLALAVVGIWMAAEYNLLLKAADVAALRKQSPSN